MRVARRYLISGRVQGVGFRYFAETAARPRRPARLGTQPAGRPRRSGGGRRGGGGRTVRARHRARAAGARVERVEVDDIVPSGRDTDSRRQMTMDISKRRFVTCPTFRKPASSSTTSRRCCRTRPVFAPRSTASRFRSRIRASTSWSASRAAGSSSAPRSPIASAPDSRRCASPASCRRARVRATYDLEYGTDSLEIHEDAVQQGPARADRGRSAGDGWHRARDRRSGARPRRRRPALAFLIELVALNGREKLAGETGLGAFSSIASRICGGDRRAAAISGPRARSSAELRAARAEAARSRALAIAADCSRPAQPPRSGSACAARRGTRSRRASRQLFPAEFAALDRAAGGTFPFTTEQIQAAHAQWTADWLAWERAHDAEYKLKAAVARARVGGGRVQRWSRARGSTRSSAKSSICISGATRTTSAWRRRCRRCNRDQDSRRSCSRPDT